MFPHFDLQPSRLAFVLGIDRRSGTNHFFRLLRRHPRCVAATRIPEDFLLPHSPLLVEYVNKLFQSWNPSWKAPEKVGSREELLAILGKALAGFLAEGTPQAAAKTATQAPHLVGKESIQLTKTPSVEGIGNIDLLFPGAVPIVLVRDGRSLVESFIRTFGGDFEVCSARWKRSARIILDWQESMRAAGRPTVIVRYEDLVRKERATLEMVFEALGLEAEEYDFDAAESLGVVGTCELADGAEGMHWRPVEKPPGFDPVNRFSTWNASRLARFREIAGEELQLLGYDPDDAGAVT